MFAKFDQKSIIFFDKNLFDTLGGYIKSDNGYPPTKSEFPANRGISVACAAPINFLKFATNNLLWSSQSYL